MVPLSSTRAAELVKLLESIHSALNIGLVNEIKMVAGRMGLDIHESARAAVTKPFGFTPYYQEPGLGGHRIPIDPFYPTWKARQYAVDTRLIELAGEVNRAMPVWGLGKLAVALNERERALKGGGASGLGIAYKKNVDDVRESPVASIMEILRARGAWLPNSDTLVAALSAMRAHRFALTSIVLEPETLDWFDCVVLVTGHDALGYEMIERHALCQVETRGCYASPQPNLVHA